MYEFQSGFRSSYSTYSCLIHLIDHIKSRTAKGLFTGMVLLDLQKAFDTVDDKIFGEKLKVIGVESVSWFKSYLTNRKQIVSINGVNSDVCNVTCGVPQGSLLDPLLFFLFMWTICRLVLNLIVWFYYMQMILQYCFQIKTLGSSRRNCQLCWNHATNS